MASTQIRVEIGAWVESTTPKASGKGMRKVWVSPTPKGESARLSVIATRDKRETHVLTLHVGTVEQRAEAREVIALALSGLDSMLKAPKAPTPPAAVVRNPAPAKGRDAIVAKARQERAALSVGKPAPAPASLPTSDTWFADLMHAAGAI